MCLVEREREVRMKPCRLPTCHLLVLIRINDRDLLDLGYVNENLLPRAIDLEALWMSLEPDIGDLLASHRIDHCERAASIAHQDAMRGIDTHVVGVISQSNR